MRNDVPNRQKRSGDVEWEGGGLEVVGHACIFSPKKGLGVTLH